MTDRAPYKLWEGIRLTCTKHGRHPAWPVGILSDDQHVGFKCRRRNLGCTSYRIMRGDWERLKAEMTAAGRDYLDISHLPPAFAAPWERSEYDMPTRRERNARTAEVTRLALEAK